MPDTSDLQARLPQLMEFSIPSWKDWGVVSEAGFVIRLISVPVPGRAAQDFARKSAGHFAIGNDGHAIDQDVLHAF